MEKLIEELTKVNPSNLSEEGLKLFNKINEIIDINKDLEEEREVHAETICQLEKENNELNNAIHKEYELGRAQAVYEVNEYWKSLIKEKIEEIKEKDKACKTYTRDGRENFILEYSAINILEELIRKD